MNQNEKRKLKFYAQENRSWGTKGEAILWSELLRAKQLGGYQFNRQFVIGNYIVDFICRKLKLIIEIDGSSHFNKGESDFDRQQFLEDEGYLVIRFSEGDVIYQLNNVAIDVMTAVESQKEILGFQG